MQCPCPGVHETPQIREKEYFPVQRIFLLEFSLYGLPETQIENVYIILPGLMEIRYIRRFRVFFL